ncbi:glutathione peroxidase [Roseivirga misakiensis]|uniref:Glutathione peroxidase n=1 Tax=Roseivirga misakiensis TaxID=1563681 RepID=A0A1E5T2D0_9BACT|nr:glutathione peroxidase [Roseivirga misakiensis]OEK05519.1 glutathione peroxidase [Roseivirga misakiensis]
MGFHNFKLQAIDGKEIDFDKYKGKKVLLVNVASACGYTPQYEDLQMLSNQFGNKVEVIGIPANNFGGQEPGSNSEIQEFCKANYGVTFQMLEKISVVGKDRHPLYKWLEEESGKVPNWNFCKYLINEKGEVVGFFPSAVNPLEEAITSKL